jgi:sensor domain CHASE-containing protein
VRTCLGIVAFAKEGSKLHWSDMPLYGGAPALLDVAIVGVAAGVWNGWASAPAALAALLMVLMLVAIRNAWDLITWIAPGVPPDEAAPPGSSS